MSDKKSVAQIQQEKYDNLMEGVSIWAAFYRANPHRFAADYLNIQLGLFQKILLYVMNSCTVFNWIASRGSMGLRCGNASYIVGKYGER